MTLWLLHLYPASTVLETLQNMTPFDFFLKWGRRWIEERFLNDSLRCNTNEMTWKSNPAYSVYAVMSLMLSLQVRGTASGLSLMVTRLRRYPPSRPLHQRDSGIKIGQNYSQLGIMLHNMTTSCKHSIRLNKRWRSGWSGSRRKVRL